MAKEGRKRKIGDIDNSYLVKSLSIDLLNVNSRVAIDDTGHYKKKSLKTIVANIFRDCQFGKEHINEQNDNGDTILHLILKTAIDDNYSADALMRAVKLGAKIDIKNKDGKTAHDLFIELSAQSKSHHFRTSNKVTNNFIILFKQVTGLLTDKASHKPLEILNEIYKEFVKSSNNTEYTEPKKTSKKSVTHKKSKQQNVTEKKSDDKIKAAIDKVTDEGNKNIAPSKVDYIFANTNLDTSNIDNLSNNYNNNSNNSLNQSYRNYDYELLLNDVLDHLIKLKVHPGYLRHIYISKILDNDLGARIDAKINAYIETTKIAGINIYPGEVMSNVLLYISAIFTLLEVISENTPANDPAELISSYIHSIVVISKAVGLSEYFLSQNFIHQIGEITNSNLYAKYTLIGNVQEIVNSTQDTELSNKLTTLFQNHMKYNYSIDNCRTAYDICKKMLSERNLCIENVLPKIPKDVIDKYCSSENTFKLIEKIILTTLSLDNTSVTSTIPLDSEVNFQKYVINNICDHMSKGSPSVIVMMLYNYFHKECSDRDTYMKVTQYYSKPNNATEIPSDVKDIETPSQNLENIDLENTRVFDSYILGDNGIS